ncbi:MAG: pyruvate kinase [Oscillospiraceae bacterium]|nr:pyruvate kinase [Oscillospiraceae bacterium]MBQ4544990.1 pyruvate kinase [Oscillospiraceae bacterium]MBQ6902386.1 pyruvate kinase [Oscillospiraceae bacterium]
MRKTKIVATIGPASAEDAVFEAMCLAGLNVARLNFSHGTHAEHQEKLDMIKRVREKLNLPVAIMLDTKGPEYRIKTFKNDKVTVKTGDTFTFTTDDVEGDETRVSVNYKGLAEDLSVGDRVLVNNGLVIFGVREINGSEIICTVLAGGELSNRKSMSFPNKVLNTVYLSEQDKEDLLFGIENKVDFVAASFVSSKQDVLDVKNFLRDNGGEGIEVIAKIENRSGVDNIEEICEACEGIMVARGDLGVEVPFAELPAIQKYLITKCRLLGKRVITATEMLESMIYNPRPTRAEISDVANAVYDGTSAVMLSGETAAGKYPVETVKAMGEIVGETEKNINYEKRFRTSSFKIKNQVDAISHATCGMAIDIGAKAIVVSSMSGMTVRMVSRFRAPTDIVGMATNKAVWYKLALSWGVLPVLSEQFNSSDVLFYHATRAAKENLPLEKGDLVVLTGGIINGKSGNTNTIKVEEI